MIRIGDQAIVDPAEVVNACRWTDGKGICYQIRGSTAVNSFAATEADWLAFRAAVEAAHEAKPEPKSWRDEKPML